MPPVFGPFSVRISNWTVRTEPASRPYSVADLRAGIVPNRDAGLPARAQFMRPRGLAARAGTKQAATADTEDSRPRSNPLVVTVELRVDTVLSLHWRGGMGGRTLKTSFLPCVHPALISPATHLNPKGAVATAGQATRSPVEARQAMLYGPTATSRFSACIGPGGGRVLSDNRSEAEETGPLEHFVACGNDRTLAVHSRISRRAQSGDTKVSEAPHESHSYCPTVGVRMPIKGSRSPAHLASAWPQRAGHQPQQLAWSTPPGHLRSGGGSVIHQHTSKKKD